jgi:hypothetical protein
MFSSFFYEISTFRQAINNVEEEIRVLEAQSVTNQSHQAQLEQQLSCYQGLFCTTNFMNDMLFTHDHDSEFFLVPTFLDLDGFIVYIVKLEKRISSRKIAQVVTDLQTSSNKVVVKPISGCVRTVCSQLL